MCDSLRSIGISRTRSEFQDELEQLEKHDTDSVLKKPN